LRDKRFGGRKQSRRKIAIFSRKSISSAENETGGRKITAPAELLALSLKLQMFGRRSETSRTSADVPGLRRISSDYLEFPADDSDFQRHGRNAADSSSKQLKGAIFRRALDRRTAAQKICSRFDIFSDSLVRAEGKSRISPTIV
jgi:hypothetical protein